MPGTPTTRYALATMAGAADAVATIDNTYNDAIAAIDAMIATADKGVLASRDTSSLASPGILGRCYYATDTTDLYFDYGTGWLLVSSVTPWRSVARMVQLYYGSSPIVTLLAGRPTNVLSGTVTASPTSGLDAIDYPSLGDNVPSGYKVQMRVGLRVDQSAVAEVAPITFTASIDAVIVAGSTGNQVSFTRLGWTGTQNVAVTIAGGTTGGNGYGYSSSFDLPTDPGRPLALRLSNSATPSGAPVFNVVAELQARLVRA